MPTKTANTFLSDKVALRANHLPPGKELYILDCFAGKGLIWAAVKELTGRKIVTLPIDTSKEVGFRLPGDNREYLDTLDLSQFDCIDLDSYGIPYDQLKIIFNRGYKGVVFVTFIQTFQGYGHVPAGLLEDVGFSRSMVERIPTLFGNNAWGYFLEWLALRDVKSVIHRSHSRKHYLCFSLAHAVRVINHKKKMIKKNKKIIEPVVEDSPVLVIPAVENQTAVYWRGSKRG